jgi:RimJ/RimL family protein N-acetyltransferase
MEDDWRALLEYAADMNAVKYMDWGPSDERETKSFLKLAIAQQSESPRLSYEFAVTLKETGRVIGAGGVRIRDVISQNGDFGYILHPDFWGNGLGTEVAKALVRFGQNELDLHRIWATCRPENLPSAHVLEKAGCVCEGRLRGNKKVRGQWVDSLLYAIVKE